jgi:hypothetical protein
LVNHGFLDSVHTLNEKGRREGVVDEPPCRFGDVTFRASTVAITAWILCDWLTAYLLYKHIPESGCSKAANGIGPIFAENDDVDVPSNIEVEEGPLDGAIIEMAAGGNGWGVSGGV